MFKLRSEIKPSVLTIFAILLFSFLLAYYFPFLSGTWAFYRSDLSYLFEPSCRFVGQSLARGHFPLWNSYLGCGLPQFAELSPNNFSPFTLVFACCSFSRAFAVNLLIHQLICGIGAFLLIRRLGWGYFAGIMAGIVCSLNGFMFSTATIYEFATCAVWVPLLIYLLLCVQQNALAQKRGFLIALSLVVAMLILDGRPEIYGPVFVCIFGWYAVQLIRLLYGFIAGKTLEYSRELKMIGYPLLSIVCGILLAAPSFLPAVEWARLSNRAHGLSSAEVLNWSANWYDWLGLALPQPLGDSQQLFNPLPFLATDMPDCPALVDSSFVGAPVIVLAILGACSNWWRRKLFVLSLLLLFAVLAAGKYLPVLPSLLNWFPQIALFRYPMKAMVLVVFLLAVLAAAGIKSIRDKTAAAPHFVIATVFTLPLLYPTIAIRLGWQWLSIGADRVLSVQLEGYDLTKLVHSAEHLIATSCVVAFVSGTLCLAICVLHQCGKIRLPLAASVVIALVLIPLSFEAFANTRHGAESGFFLRPSYLHDQLQRLGYDPHGFQPRLAQMYADSLVPPRWYHAPRVRMTRADVLQYSRQLLDLNLNEDFDVPSIFCYEGRIKGNYWHLCDIASREASVFNYKNPSDVPIHRLCQLTAVSFVTTQAYERKANVEHPMPVLDPSMFSMVHESKKMNVRIFSVKDALSRAYFRSKWSSITARDSVLPKVLDPHSNYDPLHVTYVEDRDEDKSSVAPGQPGESLEQEKSAIVPVRVEEKSPEHLLLKLQTTEPGIVVLSDQYYPGWEAQVDSVPARIFRVNGFQRGVKVAPGGHTIEFTYRPQSLFAGLWIFVAGIVLLSVSCLFHTRSR